MVESCILQIAISQDWVDGFLISQRLWVRKTWGHILKLSWFHNSCKHNFYVTKTPKTHLRLYSHSTVTVLHISIKIFGNGFVFLKVLHLLVNKSPLHEIFRHAMGQLLHTFESVNSTTNNELPVKSTFTT